MATKLTTRMHNIGLHAVGIDQVRPGLNLFVQGHPLLQSLINQGPYFIDLGQFQSFGSKTCPAYLQPEILVTAPAPSRRRCTPRSRYTYSLVRSAEAIA